MKRSVVFLGKTAVTALLLIYVIRQVELEEVIRRIEYVGYNGLITGIVSLFLLTFTGAIRWGVIIRHFQELLSFANSWKIVILGSFFSQFLPSTIGGDAFRIWYASDHGVSLGTAASSVLIDRVIAFLALTILAFLAIPYLLTLHMEYTFSVATVLAYTGSVFIIIIALSLDKIILIIRETKISSYLTSRYSLLDKTVNTLSDVSGYARSMLMEPRGASIALSISFLNILAVGLLVYYFGKLMGAGLGILPAVFLTPPVLLVSVLPVSLAGWGVRETAMVIIFNQAGVTPENSIGISICFGICCLISSLPGAGIWILNKNHDKAI